MTIAFSYSVNGVRVLTEGSLADVVKEVDITVTGVDGDASFSLPVTVKLPEPDPENFTDFANLTEAQLVAWVDVDPLVAPIKDHVAFVVAKELAKNGMQDKPLPWAPPPPDPSPAIAPVPPEAA